ncbi:MAG: aspartate aminotransferase family protein [Desulfarculus sp.]|nr:aspartate aminotransferase family protein [Desulfarculus sp.]
MSQTTQQKIDQWVMNTYARNPVTFVEGDGCQLKDEDGKTYLDFLAGIAVCNLGHAHPGVAQAICNQALKLTHVSNLYYTQPQARVAELLVKHSFADQVFFCNSGAEANEGALKLARLWGKEKLNGAFAVVTMQGSFHGRTMATLAATGQVKIQKGYDPLLPEFRHVPFGDLQALQDIWDENICAVLMEPVLGEGGVLVPPPEFLAGVRALCDQRGALLIFDEIQTGLGRTGRLFAHEHFGVAPDVMTLAKALANGLPAGAILARREASALFGAGAHASTFGAGPVVMAAAAVVLETLTDPKFMGCVQETGAYFKDRLLELAGKHPQAVEGVRGLGLMLGLALTIPGAPLVKQLLQMGFVANCTQDTVLRFLPPLVVTTPEIDALIGALSQVLAQARPEVAS